MSIRISLGQASGHTYALVLVDKAADESVLAMLGDTGYDSDVMRSHLSSGVIESIIPTRVDRITVHLLNGNGTDKEM